MKRVFPLAVALYVIGGLATFGYAAQQAYVREDREYAFCRAHFADRPFICMDDRSEAAAANGFLAAIFWPLYLSWELYA